MRVFRIGNENRSRASFVIPLISDVQHRQVRGDRAGWRLSGAGLGGGCGWVENVLELENSCTHTAEYTEHQ